VWASVKRINEENKTNGGINQDELDEKVIRNSVLYSKACITPMAAFFGGVVAQEIVKFTGKYSPLKQWLHYDIFETLPRTDQVNREPLNCRYDDQILVYGREVQEKLSRVRTFMIGAGALGCEFVKAFALMGLGCSEHGKVTVTDNDNIEVSNLNRQFLFRKNNVGESKSKVACEIAADINKGLNVQSYKLYVSQETENIFHDKFWDSLDFIVNAVDNIKARLYVDSRCVWYAKPLLESGTLGTKANSQMIIPHKTQCYGDSQDPPEESIPMCTLRNFPNQIEHCIEWGRDLFNKYFVDRPNDAAGYIEKPQAFVGALRQNTTSSGVRDTMEEIKKLVDLKKSADFSKCVSVAREYFESLFNHQIANLLHIFPIDHKDKDGILFWSGPKRAPTPFAFDPSDPLHVHFVTAAANLIAYNLGITQSRDISLIKSTAAATVVAPFVPKIIKVELPGEANQ
jgi:ubiquitin-activating enzyme E1